MPIIAAGQVIYGAVPTHYGGYVDWLDYSHPPQLCSECGRPLNVDFAADEGLALVLMCPEHGAQGLIDPTAR